MIEFVLILFVHAGMLSKGDSMALTTVPGFKTAAACVKAGNDASSVVGGTVKSIAFKCVEVPK